MSQCFSHSWNITRMWHFSSLDLHVIYTGLLQPSLGRCFLVWLYKNDFIMIFKFWPDTLQGCQYDCYGTRCRRIDGCNNLSLSRSPTCRTSSYIAWELDLNIEFLQRWGMAQLLQERSKIPVLQVIILHSHFLVGLLVSL